MRISIRLRIILALNAFVIILALTLGWIAQDVAGRLVEERYVKEMVSSASGFLQGKRFPQTPAMMGYLRELFNAEWISSRGTPDGIVASSLPEEVTEAFRQQISRAGDVDRVQLGDTLYHVDSADISTVDPLSGQSTPGYLFMLAPDAQFQEARRLARRRVARIVWPTVGLATLLAVLLSISITRPIHKLAAKMDHLSGREDFTSPESEDSPMTGPSELANLTESFHRLLRRLEDARQQMIQSEQLATLGKLSVNVAHELRNPLSGIQMNIRVLKDREDLKDDAGIEAIDKEIARMRLYLDELMCISPTAASEQTLATHPVTLSDLVESVLVIMASRCSHAQITLQKEYPLDEPLVLADGNKIRQAIMNMLINAIEATPAGGLITLHVEMEDAVIRFEVADTGKGIDMDPEDVFRIFSSSKPNGTGLGLYISRQIIEQHGGGMGCRNGESGAIFWFELPLEKGSKEG